MAKKASPYYAFALALVLAAGLVCAGIPYVGAQPSPDPTARQATINARVDARFTATAAARQEAILEQTVDAAFGLALTATSQAYLTQGGVAVSRANARSIGQLAVITGVTRLEGIVFSPNGDSLAWVSSDNGLRLWSFRSSQQTLALSGRNSMISYIEFSPDGGLLATANRTSDITLWNTSTGQPVTTVPNVEGLGALKFSPDGALLAAGGSDGSVRLWDIRRGQTRGVLTDSGGAIVNMVFSPDGQRLAAGGDNDTIVVWNVQSGFELGLIHNATSRFSELIFSPNGLQLASVDNSARVWDIATGDEQFTLLAQFATFNRDLTTLASGTGTLEDGSIALYNVATGEVFSVIAHNGIPIGFTRDSGVLITGGVDNTIRLWDVVTGEELAELQHDELFNGALSADGRYIATWGLDNTIRIWGIPAGL